LGSAWVAQASLTCRDMVLCPSEVRGEKEQQKEEVVAEVEDAGLETCTDHKELVSEACVERCTLQLVCES